MFIIYLKDSSISISDCIVVLNLYPLQMLDQAALEISAFSRFHGSVNETLEK